MTVRDPGFAVVDVETTGLFPERGDRIVEVAVVLVAPSGAIVEEWTSLVNPGRAVAATRIHGLTSADVRRAPTFTQLVGELNARVTGKALVAHNAPFDLAFLELEYARAGWSIPDAPYLCTLEASHTYLPQISRRRLSACCTSAGIVLDDAHTALGDARAVAALLRYYLEPNLARPEHVELPRMAAGVAWPSIPRTPGLEVPRAAGAAKRVVPSTPGTLARLLDELPLSGSGESDSAPKVSGYIELVMEVLEDGVLTDSEASALFEFAKRYSLSRLQVEAAHREFLLTLARRVVEDGKVTRDERQELLATAEALGRAAEVVKIMNEARTALSGQLGATCKPLPEAWQFGEPLRVGDGVAFTGCDDLERARLEGSAQAAGLRVTGAVSRKTVMLVTDGADSSTTKARKALEYGTRVVSPDVFGAMLQYVQPAIV